MRSVVIPSTALFINLFLLPISVSAEPDVGCLNTAITDRAKSMKDAYKLYADDMNKAVDALTKGEQDAVKNKDQNYIAFDTARAYANLTYSIGDSWNRMNVTIAQAWNNYYGRRASCGFATTAPAAYGGTNYYGGYGYGGGYSSYGGGYQRQCPTPVLAPVRAGCGYECTLDKNGCQRCREACRTPVSYSDCGCTTQYDPVCSRSGRTYDNACIAVCIGESVWYDGSCR